MLSDTAIIELGSILKKDMGEHYFAQLTQEDIEELGLFMMSIALSSLKRTIRK